MITSNISSNTIFSTKSEQCSRSRGVTAGYKTAVFIPFMPFFIPIYTRLYPIIPYSKKHKLSPWHISAPSSKCNYPRTPFFQKLYPGRLHRGQQKSRSAHHFAINFQLIIQRITLHRHTPHSLYQVAQVLRR